MKNLKNLKICDCAMLERIVVKDSDLEKGSFWNVQNIQLISTILDSWFIRPSSTEFIYDRNIFILSYNLCYNKKYYFVIVVH